MKLKNQNGDSVDLILYKYDSCPFCQRVMQVIKALNLDIPMQDTRKDPQARQTLVRVGGKPQVPCLFINGKPLYESDDIIDYLQSEIKAA